jgi:hypothetical protein
MKSNLRIVGEEEPRTILPLTGRAVSRRPEHLKYLLIAPPKWGKSTLFSGCPKVCLFAFEAGYSEIDCPKIVITDWDRPYKKKKLGWDEDDDGIMYTSAMEVVEEMEEYCPYNLVILDTIDMATKMASEYSCGIAHIEHPGEGGDYGRGWELYQTKPIRMFYNRLVRLGIGVACITHSTEKDKTNKFGGKVRIRKETSLAGQVQHFVHTQSDVIMHGDFARLRLGQKERDRYISFDGTAELMAGTRIRKVYIPNKYIVTPPTRDDDSPPWKQWSEFFTNSPEAGQLAEQDFVRLFKGKDDERLAEVEGKSKIEKHSNVKKEIEKRKLLKKASTT